MLSRFYPTYLADSAYDIDYAKLYERGFRALLFDIDNTLVPHGADATPRAEDLLRKLRGMGFKVLLLSDNSRARVRQFNHSFRFPTYTMRASPHPAPTKRPYRCLA